jgi:hypothetical protein
MKFFPDNFNELLDARVAEGLARCAAVETYYRQHRVAPEAVGQQAGLMQAASILTWCRIAEVAGVPYIPVEVIATISMPAVFELLDGHSLTGVDAEQLAKAEAYAEAGGFWRTELCAGDQVKYAMSEGQPLPEKLPLFLDDPRLIELHWGMPEITIVGRPRLTPVRVNGYPVEFRVFLGPTLEAEGAVSWYYPQAGPIDLRTQGEQFQYPRWLSEAMSWSRWYGRTLYEKRAELGLVPWLAEVNEGVETAAIGATLDFMLTQELGLVLVDAGPGYGYGAHPCCFIDQPVQGRIWELAPGVSPR